ncbi:MAG: hypothetical protein EOP10_22455 [Proteobacteria bacterium]|nr:MAG: hypothetical protein EOP10_22455 [Pseudomonadota bacterium]
MGAKKLSPSDKAAIIIATLGEDLAPQVFASLGVEDSAKIGRSLRGLGSIDLQEIEVVLNEFLLLLQSPNKAKSLDVQTFMKNLQAKKGANNLALLENLGTPDYSMRVFARTRPEILYRVISKETPQTLALILSHAPTDFGAALVKLIPEALRIDVLLRMARLLEVDPEMIAELDEQLIADVDKLGSASQKIGGIKKVAEILNAMNQEAGGLLEKISERQPTLAADIQQEMFTFADLLKINDRGIAEIVKGVKRESLILALRGSPGEMVQKFAKGMSERSAKMFREDLEALGAQKKSDVMKARDELLAHARSLIEAGKVEFGGSSGEYV